MMILHEFGGWFNNIGLDGLSVLECAHSGSAGIENTQRHGAMTFGRLVGGVEGARSVHVKQQPTE